MSSLRVFAAVKAVARIALIITEIVVFLYCAARLTDEVTGWAMYNDGPSVTVMKKEGSTRAIVLGVGLGNSGNAVLDLMGKRLSDEADASIIAIEYGQRDFDEAELYGLVMGALNTLKPRQLMFYGGSLGAQLDAGMATRYQADGMPYGKLLLLLDHPTSSLASIKLPVPKVVFRHGRWFAGGLGGTLVKSFFVARALKDVHAHEDLDPKLIQAHKHAMIWWPWPGFVAQTHYASEHPVNRYDLRGVVATTWIVTGPELDGDPAVRLTMSITEWTQAVGHVQHVVDPDRGYYEHNPAAERPTFMAKQARNMFELAA